jgi:hypothetical protein
VTSGDVYRPGPVSGDVEVSWADPGGQPCSCGLESVAGTAFEDALPARKFASYRRQRHFPGLWWLATTGRHVGFESWLERDHAMLLDFDRGVCGLSSQPFTLAWRDPAGKEVSHTPDYFARMSDGSAVVIDVRPADRVKPPDAAKFAVTASACAAVPGWSFRLVHEPDPVLAGNVRWLSGYRHPRHDLPQVSGLLREVFAGGERLLPGAERAGDPIGVLPVLFHLMWRGDLLADVSVPMHDATLVSARAAG